jgi:predicted nucleic acid-binding protein
MNVYLDAMQWIYFYEHNPSFYSETRAMVVRAQSSASTFLASHFTLAEILVLPKRNRDLFLAAKYRRFFLSQAVRLVPFGTDAAERFADLRASNRVKPADALHLALAALAGSAYFITTDIKFHALTIPGIRRIGSPGSFP